MKIGDFIKPVRNTGGHSYTIGKKYRRVGNNITESELALCSINKLDLDKNIKNLEFELDKNKKMSEYLTEENKEELDPNEFFAWHLIRLMESTDPNKKEKISKILNSITNNINIDVLSQH